MGQLYVAMNCKIESVLQTDLKTKMKLQFFHSMMLRPDIPCDPECITKGPYFFQNNSMNVFAPCYACPDGVFYPFNETFENYAHFWIAKIPRNATALVVSTGAWYNFWKRLYDPFASFNETIHRIAPILGKFVARGTHVFWLDLPPMPELTTEKQRLFGWYLFPSYNALAKKVLEAHGVIYIDSSRAVGPRKMFDGNITEWSHLHWCNPGPATIPEFIGQAVLHMLSLILNPRKTVDLPAPSVLV